MILSHSLYLVVICVWFFHCNAFKSGGKQEKFKVILEDVYHCSEPNPPYMKISTIQPVYTITSVNGKRYLSGVTNITEPTAFRNFSGRTFTVDRSGRRDVKMQIAKVSCSNVFTRSILMFCNISFTRKNCMVHKGSYHYELDLDRVMHSLPSWHAPGVVLHQLQMVLNGATVFCEEISVKISPVK